MAQGRTNPYLCKGDDGKQYVVKGSSATCAGLVKEWIVAHLAKDFGLPIPDFKIAWLDHDLVANPWLPVVFQSRQQGQW